MKKKIGIILSLLLMASLGFGQNHSDSEVLRFVSEYERVATQYNNVVNSIDSMVNTGNTDGIERMLNQCKNIEMQANNIQAKTPFYQDEIVANEAYTNRILRATEKISTAAARLENIIRFKLPQL
ncbi:MAG: hypothetical protein HDR37_03460 [Treponema sp.]|nr:hypothetical protein [Treponema sp.]